MRRYVTYVLKQHLQVTRMKIVIVAMLALVASAYNGPEKREIGISSGYGGAYGYTPTPISISDTKYLKSDAVPQIVNPITELLSSVGISKSGIYDYSSTPVVNVNKDLPASFSVSSGYGGAYGYVPTPNFVIPNKKILSSPAISSGYGGAYGYSLPGSVVGVSNGFKVNVANSNGYSFTLPRSAVNVKSESQPGVATSTGYGGAYGYVPIPKVIIMNSDLPSEDAISGSNSGANSPKLTINVTEQETEMAQKMMANKMVSQSQILINFLPGYSGYGNRISSDSGFSRYPDYVGYGFAYANGWLW